MTHRCDVTCDQYKIKRGSVTGDSANGYNRMDIIRRPFCLHRIERGRFATKDAVMERVLEDAA